jgi:hypothetical protein
VVHRRKLGYHGHGSSDHGQRVVQLMEREENMHCGMKKRGKVALGLERSSGQSTLAHFMVDFVVAFGCLCLSWMSLVGKSSAPMVGTCSRNQGTMQSKFRVTPVPLYLNALHLGGILSPPYQRSRSLMLFTKVEPGARKAPTYHYKPRRVPIMPISFLFIYQLPK